MCCQELVWTFSEKRKFACCPRNQAPDHPVHNVVIIELCCRTSCWLCNCNCLLLYNTFFVTCILQTTDTNYFIIILYSKSCKKITFTWCNCTYSPFNVNLVLPFKWLGWYLYFNIWFLKNVLFEQEKVKLWCHRYFVENKRDYGTCLKSAVNVLVT